MRVLGSAVLPPPIRHVQTWAAEYRGDRPVLDVSQGTSGVIPPQMADASEQAWVSYGEREGSEGLREALASDVRDLYRTGYVEADDILVTAGCNEAFCAVAGALVGAGDEVVLLSPFYFNHDMWLRLIGARPTYVPMPFSGDIDEEHLEDAARSARLIVAASPSNPTGAELSRHSFEAIERVCRKYGIPFVLDETYSVFRRDAGNSPHELFGEGWHDYLISLRSLSKEFSMPGHRIGAAIAGPALLQGAAKWHDCMSIVAPTSGQNFAEFALNNLRGWRHELAARIRSNGETFVKDLRSGTSPFVLDSWGGFFLWLAHPLSGLSDEAAAQSLAKRLGVLSVPGSYFAPTETGRLRVSAAGLSPATGQDLLARLNEVESW